MISLPQALALAVGPANVAAAGHAVADWFDGRNCSGAADLIREHLRDQSNQPAPDAVPHNRPDTSLRAELMAELASQQEVVSSLRERVERLEMRADGLMPWQMVERRWAKEAAGGDKLDRLIAQDRADEPAVPGSQRLATHPDGTPMISIGKAEDLNTIARLAADPEHARAVLADEPAVPEDMEPAAVVGEPSDDELLATLSQAVADFPPRHPEAEALCVVEYEVELELRKARAVWNRARQASQPAPPAEGEVGEPSDEELLELTEDWPATTGPRHDLSGCPEVPLYSVFADEVVEFARAVLARWGHQPTPPGNKNTPASPESTEMNRD
jgi:hypothetical protein